MLNQERIKKCKTPLMVVSCIFDLKQFYQYLSHMLLTKLDSNWRLMWLTATISIFINWMVAGDNKILNICTVGQQQITLSHLCGWTWVRTATRTQHFCLQRPLLWFLLQTIWIFGPHCWIQIYCLQFTA